MRTALAIALAALLLGGCPRVPNEFVPRVAQLRRIAIVPAHVQLIRIVFSGDDEPLLAEGEQARRELTTSIAPELESHGFVVQPARLDEADLATDSSIRYVATVTRARQLAAADAVFKGQPAGSLGPDVGALADHADVDAFLFVNLIGFTKSGGQVARDVAVTFLTLGNVVYRTSASRLLVMLVDGTTGQVLWWSWETTEELAFEGAPLRDLVHALFVRMPKLPPSGG